MPRPQSSLQLIKDVVKDADLSPGSPVRLGTAILFTINWVARERLWPGEDRERDELRFDAWVRAVQRIPVVLAERARPSWLFSAVWRMLARLAWWKKKDD
ncbi:hypothetical protein NEMBOFW57_008610 [Staphylotrichum longicolle]|uniref:Uncharacterized protein n=1 Tax=Staphylotrichum longicolle TaxID=669026 RepID=A0AAD4ERK8_9PEZI|nr:hypothetical protein NEMBOFW57_008610 [Staphylotrichum longicolle]